MSSLSVTGKQIESLSATLIGLQESFAAIASQSDVSHGRRNTLEKLAESIAKQKVEVLDALELTVSKLVAKIDYKDPVSGAQRYGQSARAKILSFQEMIAQLQNAIDALSLEVTAQLKIVNDLLGECTNAESGKEQNIVAKNIKGTPIVGPIASIDRFVDFKVEKKAEHPCEAASDDLEDQSSELEEKARLVRERRAQEAEYASHVNHLVKATLEELITHLNQIRSIQLKRIVDKDSIHQLAGPMALLFESPKNTAKDAFKTALSILERIISRPDDIAARRLRVTHPVLKEKLTGVVGGIELLLALGFQARLQAPEPASTVGAADSKAPSPAQLNVLEATVQDIRSRPFADLSTGHHVGDFATGVVRYAACVFPLLAPHTTWEMHLEMQEPSIDTLTSSASAEGVAVKVSWLDWFDSLNAYKVLVEEAIQKCV